MIPSLLPGVNNEEEYRNVYRDREICLRAILEICRRHSLPDDDLRRYANGWTIVYAAGAGSVIKLFAPYDTQAFETERLVLEFLQGKLPVPTPGVVTAGDLDGWPYIVMEQLQGVEFAAARNDLLEAERNGICHELGQAVAVLHSLPVEALGAITADWNEFIARQKEQCLLRHQGLGLDTHWLEQIPGFLEKVDLGLDGSFCPSLLHTELMADHLMIRLGPPYWKISGLIDFEPSMVGHPEYEFASVGLFVSSGDRRAFASFMKGYGVAKQDNGFPERIMAYALLHRYSNLKWYLETMPVPAGATTLEELARAWWPAT